jgi:hypothetical protein
MKKLSLALLIGLFGLILMPKTIVQAEQFDNLVQLPIDSAQEAEIDLILEGEVDETPEAGVVLGVQKEMVSENKGPHFRFGETIVINEDLTGDVYTAGGTVRVEGKIDGDLLIAGGTVILNGEVTGDVRAGAGNIILNGIIGQNLTVGGGSVVFSSGAEVGNSIVAGAGTIDIAGSVMGNVWLGSGAAKLEGDFGGDVNVQADALEIAPGVMIGGSLMTETAQEVMVDATQIGGEKKLTLIPERQVKERKDRSRKMDSVGGVLVKAAAVGFLFQFIMTLVSGSIVLYLVSKLASKLGDQVLENPLANLGWGFAYLILAPIAILLTISTVVALPIGFLMFGLYVLSLCLSKWVVAIAVGKKIKTQFKIKALSNQYLSFGTGLLVLSIAYAVPLAGGFIQLIALLLGMGVIFGLIKKTFFFKRK